MKYFMFFCTESSKSCMYFASQLGLATFKCFVAMCSWWLCFWTAQVWTMGHPGAESGLRWCLSAPSEEEAWKRKSCQVLICAPYPTHEETLAPLQNTASILPLLTTATAPPQSKPPSSHLGHFFSFYPLLPIIQPV